MRRYNILVVEDAGMIADYLGLLLIHNGFNISGIVASGEEAVATALKTKPDLVLMDIKIAGLIDGITAAAIIRRRSNVPIIYVTAYTDKKVMDRAMSIRPCAYVCKPFKGNELLETIRDSLCGFKWQGGSRGNNPLPINL